MEQATIERTPEGVEIKPSPSDPTYTTVWVDGVAMAMPPAGLSYEDLVEYRDHIRNADVVERAEKRAEEALSRDSYTREEAELGAAFIADHVLSVLWENKIVTDPDKLALAGWKIGYALTPQVVKFAYVRHLERSITSTSDDSEVQGGLLEDALNRITPIVKAYRDRI